MKSKTFRKIALAIVGLCLMFTIVHMIYVIHAYQHCSIIYFIGKELW